MQFLQCMFQVIELENFEYNLSLQTTIVTSIEMFD